MTTQRPFPLPEDLGLKRASKAFDPLTRAVISYARASFTTDGSAERIAKQMWPDDKATLAIVQRASSTEATTQDAVWAGPLATYRVQAILENLGPLSAGSQLLRQGIAFTFDGNFQIKVPGITVAPSTYPGFVGEGQPIPVAELPVSAGAILEPRKFGRIITLTSEMIKSSSAEQLVRAVLIDAVAASLDLALFSNTAGDATRPPGLLYGATSIGAAGRVGSVTDTCGEDLAALAASVSPYGGLDIVYICAPSEAVKLTFLMGPQFRFPILASSGVPAKTVICLAPTALCNASDPAPRLEAKRDVALSMDDSAPVGMPSRSMFQTDSVAIKLVMFVAWATRASGACAYVSGINW